MKNQIVMLCWVLLILSACTTQPSSAGQAPSEERQEEQNQTSSSVPSRKTTVSKTSRLEGMKKVPTGPFLFGATEEQVQLFIRMANYNYPGLAEETRQRFVIPPRTESLSEFHISEFEVTHQQFLEFIQATGYTPADDSDYLKDWHDGTSIPEWAASFPVVWVSQQDAQAYCRFRGGRLPSQEQWEKAARGPGGNLFPWGNKVTPPDVANINSERAEPVGNRPADRSPYDVYDMGGNVSELTASIRQFKGQPRVVVRGGSFRTSIREMFTFQSDLSLSATGRSESVGFRCVVVGGW